MKLIYRDLISRFRFVISGTLLLFTICFGASDEIKALARSLKGDPCLIYDYVRNNIEYVPSAYLQKGPTGTYLDGCGNDYDQASLMVALLRESGFTNSTAKYVIGGMAIPDQNLANWLGCRNDPDYITSILNFIQIVRTSGYTTRVWVKVIINGQTYLFDPAYKQYSAHAKIADIGAAMQFNINNFNIGDIGNDNGINYVKNVGSSAIASIMQGYTTNLHNYIKSQYPNTDINDLLGQRTIVRIPVNPLGNFISLPFATTNPVEYDEIPDTSVAKIKVECGTLPPYTANIADIEGQRLTITMGNDSNVYLKLDGNLINSGNAASNPNITLTVSVVYKTTKPRTISISPGTYAIVWSTEGVTYSSNKLSKHQKRIGEYIAAGKPTSSEEVLGETLAMIGCRYIRSCGRMEQLSGNIFDLAIVNRYVFGVAGQNSNGNFVDFTTGEGSIPKDTITTDYNNCPDGIQTIKSALEHGVIDQTAGAANSGISTSKGFEINDANGNKLYKVTSTGQLTYLKNNNLIKNYTKRDIDTSIASSIVAGRTVILPAEGAITIPGAQWKGCVDWEYILNADGTINDSWYLIGGGHNGGYSFTNTPVDAVKVQMDVQNSTRNIVSPSTVFNQISPTSKPMAADPVDMAGGSFTDNNTDMAIGGTFPMALTRQYSSNRSLENTQFGHGWTHNYDIKLTVGSNGDAVSGSRSASDAAPMIAAIYACVKLMSSANDVRNWAIRAMIANWAVDQLLNNSITISFGNQSMEFLKMSDGSYSPPPGINARLTKKPNGTYTMTERSGTKYEFNSRNDIEKITDIDGNKTQFVYDLLRKLIRVQDDYGHGFIFNYTSGLLSSVTDPGSRSVSYTYDTAGNLITFRDAENNNWAYTYDSQHRILTKKDPRNIVNITNVYDGDKVSRQISPLQNGSLDTNKFYISGYRNISENDTGYQTVYNFDFKGRSISTTDPLGNSTSQEYDGGNHTIRSTDPCGRKTTFTYDGNNNLLETSRDSISKSIFRYDTNFNLIEKTDAMGRRDSMFYDSKRHLIKQTVYPYSSSPITTSYTYYSNGLLKTVTNPKGVVTSYCYDAKGNKTSTQYGNDPAIKYEYNAYGMLNKMTDQLNASVTYTIDKRGLTTQTEDALGKKTYVAYYQNGLPSQTTDRNNKQTNITYTPSGKTGRIGYSDGHKTIYSYNNLDQLVSVSDSITTATFQYDTNGRVTSTTDMQGFTVANQFYPDGQLKKLIYPGNFGITYTYDTLGRLKNVQDSLADTIASYKYDASGLITNIRFGNGKKSEYHYDGAGRMTDLRHGGTADTFANYHAILDESGYPVNITGNFTDSAVADTNNISYTYDSLGTRLSSFGGTSITYDFEGQTTVKGAQTCTFNVRHLLETVSGSGYNYQYTYNESGQRVKAVRNGVTTKYIYGGGSRILAEADSANVITRYYIYGHGLIGFYVPGTGFFACHYDMSGNMIAITNDTGAVAAKFAYTPFGEVIDSVINQPACDIPVGFAGQFGVLREPNGLYYMNARYYDPTIGRFLSEDPAGLSGGDLTLYSYAGNNPVVFVDPSGLCSQSSGGPWAAVGSAASNVGLGLEYPTLGSMGGNSFSNAAWSTASQSPATFRAQISLSQALPELGKSLGRIAMPVGLAQTTIDASVLAVGGNYRGAAVEAGAGYLSAGAAAATVWALQSLDASPAAIVTIPLGVGFGVYYGGKFLFGGKE